VRVVGGLREIEISGHCDHFGDAFQGRWLVGWCVVVCVCTVVCGWFEIVRTSKASLTRTKFEQSSRLFELQMFESNPYKTHYHGHFGVSY
jgi:hypothetical protein